MTNHPKTKRAAAAFVSFSIVLVLAMYQPSSVLPQSVALANEPPPALVRVPFVGCASGGQVGPLKAPAGTSKIEVLSPEPARRLAYYQAEHAFGVLAPRGWHCFGTYGSNGSTLFVSPKPIDGNAFFSGHWSGFTGPAIEISGRFGGTSGRFEVARTIARVFPADMAFAKKVIAEGLEPANSFPQGPYPGDKLVYRNNQIVEYETPPNQTGLGTTFGLQKNGSPTSGVAILAGKDQTKDTILIHLAVRLPQNATDLGPSIIRQVERDSGVRTQ
jgi:hypothetical protein